MITLLRDLNKKFDLWSFFSDFIFVFGVIVLGWNPVLLVFLFIIDSGIMSMFANILFFLEYKSFIYSFAFLIVSLMMLLCMLALFNSIFDFMIDIDLIEQADTNYWKALKMYVSPITESYILPIILVSSGLNHYAAFDESLAKMKDGTYKSGFLKHFFLRYMMLCGIVVLMVFGQYYFNASILIGLIGVKAILRVWQKRFRTII